MMGNYVPVTWESTLNTHNLPRMMACRWWIVHLGRALLHLPR